MFGRIKRLLACFAKDGAVRYGWPLLQSILSSQVNKRLSARANRLTVNVTCSRSRPTQLQHLMRRGGRYACVDDQEDWSMQPWRTRYHPPDNNACQKIFSHPLFFFARTSVSALAQHGRISEAPCWFTFSICSTGQTPDQNLLYASGLWAGGALDA